MTSVVLQSPDLQPGVGRPKSEIASEDSFVVLTESLIAPRSRNNKMFASHQMQDNGARTLFGAIAMASVDLIVICLALLLLVGIALVQYDILGAQDKVLAHVKEYMQNFGNVQPLIILMHLTDVYDQVVAALLVFLQRLSIYNN